jgi:hypothetical protein
MAKIHGRATIRINGTVYESEDDASLAPGGLKNTAKMVGEKSYHTQTKTLSKVVCKVPVTGSVNVRDLQEMSDVEVIFESDTGATYLIRSASQTAEVELKGGDSGGTVELSFEGDPAEMIE